MGVRSEMNERFRQYAFQQAGPDVRRETYKQLLKNKKALEDALARGQSEYRKYMSMKSRDAIRERESVRDAEAFGRKAKRKAEEKDLKTQEKRDKAARSCQEVRTIRIGGLGSDCSFFQGY